MLKFIIWWINISGGTNKYFSLYRLHFLNSFLPVFNEPQMLSFANSAFICSGLVCIEYWLPPCQRCYWLWLVRLEKTAHQNQYKWVSVLFSCQTTRSLTITVKLQLAAIHLAAWWGHRSALHMLKQEFLHRPGFLKVWFEGVKDGKAF